jgi:hypothetical protein
MEYVVRNIPSAKGEDNVLRHEHGATQIPCAPYTENRLRLIRESTLLPTPLTNEIKSHKPKYMFNNVFSVTQTIYCRMIGLIRG